MRAAAKEAIRIVRSLEVHFPTGPQQSGSAFLAPAANRLLTCAHVVINEDGQLANRIVVISPSGTRYESTNLSVDRAQDLASIEVSETEAPSTAQKILPEIGDEVIFAGLPRGVKRPSVFPGMISAVGANLISQPRGEMIQIAGMINNGNSGGPLLDSEGAVVGMITAKYVPLLIEIDKLRDTIKGAPDVPGGVYIMGVDFGKFFGFTMQSLEQLAAVLRLVQVGTGWAIPAKFFSKVGC